MAKLIGKLRYFLIINKILRHGGIFDPPIASRADYARREVVTSKKDLRRWYPFGLLLVRPNRLSRYHESFGTTGVPTASLLTKRDFINYVRQVSLGPLRFARNDFVLIRYPYALSTPAHIFQSAAHRGGATVIACGSKTNVSPYPRVVDFLHRLKITVLCANPTEAILLAKIAERMGFRPGEDFPALRAIACAGELLTGNQKRYIEALWSAPVYNFYGSSECGNIAYSCERGNLHIAEDSFILHSRPVGDDQPLILSTIRKQAMPLLKYDTGDNFRYLNPCGEGCKRRSPAIELRGRDSERYELGGKEIAFCDIKDAVFGQVLDRGLSPFWFCSRDGDGIAITIERGGTGLDEEALGSALGLRPIERPIARPVDAGVVADLARLSEIVEVKKPQYFF